MIKAGFTLKPMDICTKDLIKDLTLDSGYRSIPILTWIKSTSDWWIRKFIGVKTGVEMPSGGGVDNLGPEKFNKINWQACVMNEIYIYSVI